MSWVERFSEVSRRVPLLAVLLLGAGTPALASLIINATFDSSITTDPGATGIEGAINGAISNIEADITSPHNLTVSIYFTEMSTGLGESDTTVYTPTYYQYYNAYSAVATSAVQLSALASLGTAPTSSSSGNPVDGNTEVQITSAEARNLGFIAAGTITAGSGTYDSEISLNTSLTYPPGPNNGSTYGLQSVANHEIDEALGIGGTGSTLTGTGSLTGPVGDLDLYRYSAPGVRSYTNTNSTSPLSYFSVNGGTTAVSYFNQTTGADFADWFSNCTTCGGSDPFAPGFGAQVQDAFGEPGTNPALGVSEIEAFNAIGYEVVAPEPGTLGTLGFGFTALGVIAYRRRRLS